MQVIASAMAVAAAPKPLCKNLPAAAPAVAGYATSMTGCIGAQGHDATRQLAVSVPCAAPHNVSAAAVQLQALCSATPGCTAFSICGGAAACGGRLICELHPETIAQSSQVNAYWSVWQRSGAPKAGKWPYPVGYKPPPPPPGPPPPPPPYPTTRASLVWTTPAAGVTESMPLGNGRLGVNVWADKTDTVWLLLSHVDALDENTNLDKLGRVAVREVRAAKREEAQSGASAQPFRQQMYLGNGSVHVDLPSGLSLDVWVDASADAVRVASRRADGAAHKLEATLEVWRNGIKDPKTGVKGPAPYGVPPNASSGISSDAGSWCKVRTLLLVLLLLVLLLLVLTLSPRKTLHTPVVAADTVLLGGPGCEHEGCPTGCRRCEGGPKCAGCQDRGSVFFYHRNPEAYTKKYFDIDLKNQQMPLDLENPLTNQTFGGLLSGGAGSPMLTKEQTTTGTVLVSASAAKAQSITVAGTAGRYDGGAHGPGSLPLKDFMDELTAIRNNALASPFSAHAKVWSAFWASSDITITASKAPKDAATAAAADRVTLLDKVNRAAFHNMALGKHAIKFNAYGIFSAYADSAGGPDFRVWGPCQWFQNIRLPYYHMIADGRFEGMYLHTDPCCEYLSNPPLTGASKR